MKLKIVVLLTALTTITSAGRNMLVHQNDGVKVINLTEVDSITFSETSGTTPQSRSVVLDNFEVNIFKDAEGVGEEDYTNQSTLGYQIGGYVDSNLDSLQWGGSQWFAYASDNGATVYSYNPTGSGELMIIDSLETEASSDDPKINYLFGDDSLSVVFDCRSLSEEAPYTGYWSAVGVSIGGLIEHSSESAGMTAKELIEDGYSSQNVICWDLSSLESVTIDGSLKGAIRLMISGGTSENELKYSVYSIVTSDRELTDISQTIPMSEFQNSHWQGASWATISSSASSMFIELDTEVSDFAYLKLNTITFNFTSDEGKFKAFPFLK